MHAHTHSLYDVHRKAHEQASSPAHTHTLARAHKLVLNQTKRRCMVLVFLLVFVAVPAFGATTFDFYCSRFDSLKRATASRVFFDSSRACSSAYKSAPVGQLLLAAHTGDQRALQVVSLTFAFVYLFSLARTQFKNALPSPSPRVTLGPSTPVAVAFRTARARVFHQWPL